MSASILTCTVCGQQNTFPFSGGSMQHRESMMTFCSTCSSVTLQRIALVAGAMESKGTTPLPNVSAPSSADPHRRTPVHDANDILWRRLQDALGNNGVSMAEFQRCDAPTKSRLLGSMGFGREETHKLIELADARDARRILGTNPESPQAKGQSGADGLMADTPNEFSQPLQHAAARRSDTSMPGLTIHDDGTLVARCSVYPHLPAEFWCSLCSALVSSRCHVTGVHKDHPFITLRQAAEAHIRDLKTWSERCRSQLNVASSIVANLQHAKEILHTTVKHQEEELDRSYDEIIRGLTQWRDELKSSMQLQKEAQLKNIDLAVDKTNALLEYYSVRQKNCEPLLTTIPPVHQVDKQAEDWSLRVMDLVSHLKTTSREPIPMPHLTLPEVKCTATTATYMELLKAVSVPAGVRVPDVLDTGYLNFPNPSDLGRETFTLQPPEDAKARGILLYNGRTLTRSQEVNPVHTLVCASQIFYTGITAWEVHIDRLGSGPGRVLAGVLMAGTDGEGVVWDGHRIVGPNEGECRVLSDRYALQTGTKLRFVLELEAPSYFLICYYEDEVVARVPLPPALNGWLPAFSVFGPQDQITITPTSTTAAEHLLGKTRQDSREAEEQVSETKVRLVEQEQKINSLQQQLLAVNSRISQDQYEKLLNQPMSKPSADIQHSPSARMLYDSGNNGFPARALSVETPLHRDAKSVPNVSDFHSREERISTRNDSYSPELQNILNFVNSIK